MDTQVKRVPFLDNRNSGCDSFYSRCVLCVYLGGGGEGGERSVLMLAISQENLYRPSIRPNIT